NKSTIEDILAAQDIQAGGDVGQGGGFLDSEERRAEASESENRRGPAGGDLFDHRAPRVDHIKTALAVEGETNGRADAAGRDRPEIGPVGGENLNRVRSIIRGVEEA